MHRAFWKGILACLASYSLAIVLALWIGFEFALVAVPVLQIGWGLFSAARIMSLRGSGAQEPDALAGDRASYEFSLGALLCSCTVLLALLVLSQVV
jgi:hypothetical protein